MAGEQRRELTCGTFDEGQSRRAPLSDTLPMTQPIPQTPPDYDRTRIVERPNGVFWQAKDGGREYGPFATLLEAVQDMQSSNGAAPEPGETLQEAEAEIGIAEWVDPDTGEPAEEERPRIKDQ